MEYNWEAYLKIIRILNYSNYLMIFSLRKIHPVVVHEINYEK